MLSSRTSRVAAVVGTLFAAGLLLAVVNVPSASTRRGSSLFLGTNVRATAPAGACSPPASIPAAARAYVTAKNQRSTSGSLCYASRDKGALTLRGDVRPGAELAVTFYPRRQPCWYFMSHPGCGGMALGTFSPQADGARETIVANDAAASHMSATSRDSTAGRSSASSTAERSGEPCRCEELPPGGHCLDELPEPAVCHVRTCAESYRCVPDGPLSCIRVKKTSYLTCDGAPVGNRCNQCRRVVKDFEQVHLLGA